MSGIVFAQAQTSQLADFIDQLARTPLSRVVIFVAICTTLRIAMAPYLANTPVHKRSGPFSFIKGVNEALDALVYAGVFVFLLIRPFAVQTFRIPSESMEKTLLVGDFIFANKAIYRYSEPQRGDIIVFRPPKRAVVDPHQFDGDGEVNVDYIKRCIGLPGDVVEIKDGVLFRNGKAIEEPYVPERPFFDFKLVKYEGKYIPLTITADMVNAGEYSAKEYRIDDTTKMNEMRALPAEPVPQGFLLMMGDNRNHSFDGRGWGLLPREDVIGRSECIWLPLSRIGRTRQYAGQNP